MTAWDTPRININFNTTAKKCGGVWDGQRWEVDEAFDPKMKKAFDKYFGGEKCTLKVTAKEKITGYKSPVTFAGFIVGRAFGRDSGARLGKGIALHEGTVTSGGSRSNWDTIVEKDTVVLISNFPVALIDKIKSEKWSWEIYTPEDDDDGEEEEIEA